MKLYTHKKGCADSCMIHHCPNPTTKCHDQGVPFSGCVCNKGFALLNEKCVPFDQCKVAGKTDWTNWSQCSQSGERHRVQKCLGDDCDEEHHSETEQCQAPVIANRDLTFETDDSVPDNYDPCPSEHCWTWDGKTCVLNANCVSIHCLAKSIEIGVIDGLFGPKKLEGVTPAGFTPREDIEFGELSMSGFHLSCPLGDCGMTYDIDPATDE